MPGSAPTPDPADDLADLLVRITRQVPGRSETVAVARALGWTTGPSRKGWKIVQPTGYAGGMVIPPREDTGPAEAWFDPEGREVGLAGPEAAFPPYLTSLDTALAAAPAARRADLLRRAMERHRSWQEESGRDDSALARLPGFVIAELLGDRAAAG